MSTEPAVSGGAPAPAVMEQLVFIRLLYQQGIEQAARPEPLNLPAILTFHDAVELFLVVAGQHLGGTISDRLDFLKHWKAIKELPGGVDLAGYYAMDRLNRVRNAFKHVGGLPSTAQVECARADVASFFEDNAPRVFGVAFDEIDMVAIVPQLPAKEMMLKAVGHARDADYPEALALLSEAFDWLLEDYANRKRTGHRETAITFGDSLDGLESKARHLQHRYWQSELSVVGRAVEVIARELKPMQRRLTILSAGLDYRRYAKFSMLVPAVDKSADGRRWVRPRLGLVATADHYEYCKAFVIYVALHLAAEDFDLDLVEIGDRGGGTWGRGGAAHEPNE